MIRKINAINETDLLKRDVLMVNNVEEGFANYEHLILHGRENAYREFLKRALFLNGPWASFVDFYYSRLRNDEKSNFRKSLEEEDLKYVDFIDWSEGIYFPLTEEFLPFFSKVTAREILFSTFYFSKYPCALWGNYGLKYPIFFKDQETKEIYQKLAADCGLDFEK